MFGVCKQVADSTLLVWFKKRFSRLFLGIDKGWNGVLRYKTGVV